MSRDAKNVKLLIQKLKMQGDITTEEADKIYSYFLDPSIEKTQLNSFNGDFKLMDTLEEWYKVVAEKIKTGERGNFIFTIRLDDGFHNGYMYPAKKALKEQKNFEDLCNVIMIDSRLPIPRPLKELFTEIKTSSLAQDGVIFRSFYEMINFRAGIYYYPIKTEAGVYTISQFIEKLSPVMVTVNSGILMHRLFEKVFEIASGACKVPYETYILGKKEAEAYLLAAFIRYNDFPCAVASSTYADKSVVFLEERNAFVVRKALEVPLKELTDNAVDENIINKKMAEELLKDEPIRDFPVMKFVKASVGYLDEKIRLKIARECIQEAEESEWLEEIR